jgi:FkbM family methyltransferase
MGFAVEKTRMRALIRALLRYLVRAAVATRLGLRAVNAVHIRLTPTLRRRFFYLCPDEDWRVEGPWRVEFAGQRLVLPLSRDFRWGWLAAVAFDGYDPEMHELYAALVRGDAPPRVFFDVGANHGMHSLRLLAHGVRVVSFEPNPACHAFLLDCCKANGLRPELEPVAVGEAPGSAELVVPGDRTWLGRTVPEVQESWRKEVRIWRVPQVSLDVYAGARGVVPDLVKIDVEGGEIAVLRGARRLLSTARPIVIFESWPWSRDRNELHGFFAGLGYGITPVTGALTGDPLPLDRFLDSTATNFLARPRAYRHTSSQPRCPDLIAAVMTWSSVAMSTGF